MREGGGGQGHGETQSVQTWPDALSNTETTEKKRSSVRLWSLCCSSAKEQRTYFSSITSYRRVRLVTFQFSPLNGCHRGIRITHKPRCSFKRVYPTRPNAVRLLREAPTDAHPTTLPSFFLILLPHLTYLFGCCGRNTTPWPRLGKEFPRGSWRAVCRRS